MYDEMKFSEEKEIISILLIIVKLFFSCTIDTSSGITHMKKKKISAREYIYVRHSSS